MKKAKKLLSLFLAALMLMSCFGAISASALTMDEAEAAAVEFNAAQVDHSDIYQNMSAKQWASMKGTLNATVGAVLDAVKLEETIYSDATVNMLLTSVSGLIYGALEDAAAGANFLVAALIKTVLKNISPAAVATAMTEAGAYPEIAAYLSTVSSYDEIDSSKVVWGITAGDRAAFVDAAGWALYPVGYALNLLSSLMGDLYTGALLPILESLHQGAIPSLNDFKAALNTNVAEGMHAVINPVCDAIEDIAANPIEYLCEVLPDVTNSLLEALNTLKSNSLISGMLGDVLPSDLDGLFEMIVPMIPSILGLGEDYVMPALNIPEIDENSLIHMGDAYAAESGLEGGARVAIAGDSTMVFAAVAQYVQEVLQDKGNQTAIGDLIVAKVGPEYLDNYREIVNAATNGTSLDVADACLSLLEEYLNNNGAQEETNPILAFFAKVVEFFQKIVAFIERLFGIR